MTVNLTKSKGKRGTTYCSAINCDDNKISNQELSFFFAFQLITTGHL